MTDNPYLEPPLPNYRTATGFDWDPIESMDESEAQEQMELLREAVEHHSRLYYEEFNPVVSDSVYDEMFHRLESLEDHLGIDDETSPTQKVGQGRSSSDS